jgi:Zn-dependent peptidase ImmA (M78 family)
MEENMPRSPIKQLYERLLQSSEIPVTESPDIISKGLYLTEDGKKEIYIKQSMTYREKLKVLLHEYSHHIHLTHHYNKESRAECEIIANGSAFFVCAEFGLKLFKEIDLSRFSDDADTVARVAAVIQTVADHILNGLKQIDPQK